MKLGNKAFVPSACPARFGEVDINTALFTFVVEPRGGGKRVAIFAFFFNARGTKTKGTIDTETIIVPAGSELAGIALRIFGSNVLRKRLQREMLENVKECRRPCMALDKKGLERALRKVG